MLEAANRDPEAFVEPRRLNLKRTDAKHYLCIGATLARPAIQIALQSVFQTFPEMTLIDQPLSRHQTTGYWSAGIEKRR